MYLQRIIAFACTENDIYFIADRNSSFIDDVTVICREIYASWCEV